MNKHLIGITSFGNLPFLKLAIEANRKTLTKGADIIVVVAKPGDTEMIEYLKSEGIQFIVNDVNKGLTGSLNDIFEHGWVKYNYDTITLQGNDVLPYPRALDLMIECAETTDWEWVCSTQLDSKTLVSIHPEAKQFFEGENLVFTDFSARPWELHSEIPSPLLEPNALKDVMNLALYKRSAFEKLGYFDVNFAHNSFFSDNDYVARALRTDVRACGLRESVYFHFWSRTIHQGESRNHGRHFEQNRDYYLTKWGGLPGQETKSPPVKIGDRSREDDIIRYWRGS